MLTFLTRPHFWMVLPSTAWISSRSMFSHMVGPSAWNDRSQTVKKIIAAPHTPDSSDVVLPARFQHRHGGQRHLEPRPAARSSHAVTENKASAPRGQKTQFDIKKNLPMKQTRACLSVAKSAKIHSRHRSGCSTLLRVPFRKWLVYISLFISKYSQKIKLHS